MKKRKWSRPKLIILVRNNPEEAILLGCLSCNWCSFKPGPSQNIADCDPTETCNSACSRQTDT